MGYTAKAITIVGVRMDRNNLFEEKTVFGCEHGPVKGNFCSVCGAKATKVEQKALKEFDDFEEQFGPLQVIYGNPDSDIVIVGKELCRTDHYVDGKRNFSKCQLKNFDLDDIQKEVKDFLDKYNLFNAEGFGIWSVLSESY